MDAVVPHFEKNGSLHHKEDADKPHLSLAAKTEDVIFNIFL